jgi:hypothetical protein
MSNNINHALFIGWNRTVPTREKNAVEILNGFTNYLRGLETKKQIVNFEPVMLAAHGGDLNGFYVVRADREDLNRLVTTEEWLNWTAQAQHALQGFGVVQAYLGEEITNRMTRAARLA